MGWELFLLIYSDFNFVYQCKAKLILKRLFVLQSRMLTDVLKILNKALAWLFFDERENTMFSEWHPTFYLKTL
jgi:hypothetical protein